MKQIIIVVFALLLQPLINGQENQQVSQKSFSVGITYSNFGDAIVYTEKELDGAASTDIDHFSGFGLICTYSIKKWLELESGVNFSKYYTTTRSAPIPEVFIKKGNTSLISVPVMARINFLKYFFIKGGVLLEHNGSVSSVITDQSGIGAEAGIGAKFEFKSGLSVYINPYFTEHAIVSFSQHNHHRIYDNAIRFGLTYRLK